MGRWDKGVEDAPCATDRDEKRHEKRDVKRHEKRDEKRDEKVLEDKLVEDLPGRRTSKRDRDRERSRSPARWDKEKERTKTDPAPEAAPGPPKPEFGLSGLLAAETNTTHGVLLKHQEPAEKGLPAKKWRIYVFKDAKPLDQPLMIHKQSNYLFGRDRRVVDVATDHPSCSLQHAVIQYRTTDKRGDIAVRPYLMDLKSTNGTVLNGERLEPERYYELLPKDVITFGESSREYVILTE
jgi:smad nuclear-interacting protein 1